MNNIRIYLIIVVLATGVFSGCSSTDSERPSNGYSSNTSNPYQSPLASTGTPEKPDDEALEESATGISMETYEVALRDIVYLLRLPDVSREHQLTLYESYFYMKLYYDGALTKEISGLLSPEKRASQWYDKYRGALRKITDEYEATGKVLEPPAEDDESLVELIPESLAEAELFGGLQGEIKGKDDAYSITGKPVFNDEPNAFLWEEAYIESFLYAYKLAYYEAYNYARWYSDGYKHGSSGNYGEFSADEDTINDLPRESSYDSIDVIQYGYTGPPEWAGAFRDGFREGYIRAYEFGYRD